MITALILATAMLTGSPAPNPVNVQLSGHNEVVWATDALAAGHFPDTSLNRHTFYAWACNEGTPHDFNNPLNLMTPYGGSHDQDATGDPQLQSYPTPHDFFMAFNLEMRKHGPDGNGSYAYLVAALASGQGFLNSTSQGVRDDLLAYSGNGYYKVPEWGC